jgi:hypothetical protein
MQMDFHLEGPLFRSETQAQDLDTLEFLPGSLVCKAFDDAWGSG